MKLFDYKFLILLGLTLVVYFIYREILDLKTKISTLENKVTVGITNKDHQNNKLNNKKINELTLSNDYNEKPINFQIPLPPPPGNLNLELTSNIPNLVHNMEDSEDIEILNNSGEQVAIYSNDNDKTQSYSIGESSLIESDSNNDVINNDGGENSNSLQNSDINNISNEYSDLSNDSKKKTSMVKSEGDKQLNDMSYADLMKYRLNELQCFAEECKIDILKSNGKKKTKSNLSNDIVENFSKSKSTSI